MAATVALVEPNIKVKLIIVHLYQPLSCFCQEKVAMETYFAAIGDVLVIMSLFLKPHDCD